MTIVERISASSIDKGSKLVKLWAVVMLNYRQPLGDAAWVEMALITDRETVHAIALITGFATALNLSLIEAERLKGLLDEKADW